MQAGLRRNDGGEDADLCRNDGEETDVSSLPLPLEPVTPPAALAPLQYP